MSGAIDNWGGDKGNAVEARRKQPKHLWRMKNNQVGSRLQGRLAYEPPRLSDLQHQNRVKARKYFPKKKSAQSQAQEHPHAPRNTTSFIMRAKCSGGIAPPTPSTPAVISTPDLSGVASYREGITEEVNKEWGVNGYGSMNGLIRLKEDRIDDSDSESDVDQGVQSVQQLEQRLDQDLNRFEILYTPGAGDQDNFSLAGMQLHDQENHIAHLEEENLTLKERIYILEQQLDELKQKLAQQQNSESVDEMEVCSSDGAT
ncbi:uncharacterized protein LOC112346135 [Selaginella moellendorffii]|uniref:uncharacterized protein LOC112346135 n=1 Tax=Selaginella moellendorffii TaxID=88036 RepID=UPI000D1C4DC7|nr:uncharacterized protein LOC112346135 [Selaginella moellendorffii]XP_024530106.1 uncharacterized protein LOC112346135 [Selaginella moellendorffii]XP_024530108.1 uncharacterized protein LOC112346135 [Selaginella moellendorffii]XP_024530109.1 uncharacterized protein LOC112346135 [Selaginella moellendorffii]XP_024530110.1 uncharacterized protein LOC112346135 [Selaginella moellendorffii]XP_024530111.1 uncharacterized protein LOC112346135 [Selaginella moellendorffii]XP_024530112.1 uncharacterize|eukprot:XP_024530105.1 uncharacterized protein LOC112346135 [Selaginella moellendorffii]